MFVRSWMTRTVVTVSPKTSVLNARRLLALHGFRHLPVVDGVAVVGMVSDRDIRVTDMQLSRTLASLESDLLTGRYRRIQTVMSTPAVVVGPDQTVTAAAQLMLSRRIGALPVVEAGRLVGIIGLTDCVRALLTATAAERPDCNMSLHADVDTVIRLDAGDDRPGRPETRPVALVVDPNPAARLAARNDLTALGYHVNTCPGPGAGVSCPASRADGVPCGRVWSETTLVMLDPTSRGLADVYRAWLPDADIRVDGRGDLTRA